MITETWLTQHASPRWLASRVFLDQIPDEDQEAVLEELCLAYPSWFFEVLCEIDGHPLELEPFQIRYLLDPSSFKVTNKARQSGGSMQVALAKLFKAYRNENYRCDIVSINLKEATDKIKYIRNFHETLPKRWQIPLTIDNQLSIGFHKGRKQSVIHSLAASAGVRGGRKDIFFDEFAHIPMADELFIAATPAIMRGELGIDIVSTPMGDVNLFAKIYNNAENEFGEKIFDFFSRHKFIWLDVKAFVKEGQYEKCQHVWYNEFKEDMNRMRELVEEFGTEKLLFFYRMFPWQQFQQEFCGVFLDEQTAFFPWELIKKCLKGSVGAADDVTEDFLEPWYDKPKGNTNQVFVGVDFGESEAHTDKTSIQVLERLPNGRFMHRYSEVLSKDDYPDFVEQAHHIARVAIRMGATKLSGDGTGLGRGIMPQIRKLLPEMAVEDVNFNLATKEQMVMNLKVIMEQNNLWLQADDTQLQGQIRNLKRDIHPSGGAHYHGEPHDDMFWALALAARGGAYRPFTIYSIGSSRQITI